MKKSISFLTSAAVLAASMMTLTSAAGAQEAQEEAPDKGLVILHTNDVHRAG